MRVELRSSSFSVSHFPWCRAPRLYFQYRSDAVRYTVSVGIFYFRPELVEARKRWNNQSQSVVFTNGCYDLLHPGHIRLLEQARSLGDVLILALNSDASVRRAKGPSRPLIPETERAELALGLEAVDAVTSSTRTRRELDRGSASRCPGKGRRLVAFHRRPGRSGGRRRQSADRAAWSPDIPLLIL